MYSLKATLLLVIVIVSANGRPQDEASSPTPAATTSTPPEQPLELTTLANIVNEVTETPQVALRQAATERYERPYTVLEYVPITSFYHPHPLTPAQLIPPGTPWPDSPQGYQTTLRPSKTKNTPIPPSIIDRFPELSTATTGSNKKKSTPNKPQADNEITRTTPASSASSHTVLEYVPSRPPYVPNPVTIPQIIPPGEPWPDSPPGYETSSSQRPTVNLDDRVEVSTTEHKSTTFRYPNPVTVSQIIPPGKPLPASPVTQKTTVDDDVSPQTVLEYKPSRPFYHPNPVTVSQIVPPGKPWPAKPEEKPTKSTLPPNLVDRFPELTSQISTKRTTTASRTSTTKPTTITEKTSTRIVLEYEPHRPWYHPRPGDTVGQIIPPGKPWPASPDGYPGTSVTKRPPWLRKYVDEDEPIEEFLPNSKEDAKELNLPEPNALGVYEPIQFSTSPAPFTSGPQRTTIPDILDILKEVHNITLTTNNTAPVPSHLLPYDADRESPKITATKPPHSRPFASNRPTQDSSVVNYQMQRQQPISSVQVYDGIRSFQQATNRDRIFPNPKYLFR